MTKMLYHILMSLDGFVASPGDDMAWMRGTGPYPTVDEVLPQIGALLIGGGTFFGPASDPDGEPYGGAWRGPMFVLSHRENPGTAGYTFVDDLSTAVARAKEAAGDKPYVAILGPTVAKSCLQAGLLDEVLVHVAPVLLGDGVRLFSHPGGVVERLEWIGPAVTDLRLRVPH